jgi:hypothetical protein
VGERFQLVVLVGRSRTSLVLDGLVERLSPLGVVAVFVNLDVGAGLEEVGEVVVGLRLLVEANDVLHQLLVLVPVGSLQEVGSQHVGLGAAGVVGETDHLGGIAQLDQALQGGDLVAHLDVEVGGNLETALLAALLGDDLGQLSPLALLHRRLRLLIGNHLFNQVFLDRHVLLDADIQRLLVLFGAHQQRHCAFELAGLQQGGDLGVDGSLVTALDQFLLVPTLLLGSLVRY